MNTRAWPAAIAVSLALAPAGLVAQLRSGNRTVPEPQRLAPFVPSPQNVVERMLEAARVKRGEVVYDLGSGDGRVLITAAQRFGARAVGIEISPKQVEASVDRIKELKLEERCRVIEGDLLAVDLSEADVVTIYLLTKSNEMLRPNLEIRGWIPNRIEEAEAHKRVHRLYVYEMPPIRK
jgi:SAM-dependent methyltransferase